MKYRLVLLTTLFFGVAFADVTGPLTGTLPTNVVNPTSGQCLTFNGTVWNNQTCGSGGLSPIPAGTILGNSSGSTAAPGANALDTFVDVGTFGTAVSTFNGLQFAIAQQGLGTISGTMSGYAQYDSITVACPGVTWSTSPTLAVTSVSGGAVVSTLVANPGISSGAVPGGTLTCTQASTTGSGTGFRQVLTLGVIASYVSPASLSTGGATTGNGSFFLNQTNTDGTTFFVAGPENTFIGDKAGYGFTGLANSNTAVGHNACGSGSVQAGDGFDTDAIAVTCYGNDSGRNINGTARYDAFLGWRSGANEAGSFNTGLGDLTLSGASNTPGTVTGNYNLGAGYGAGSGLTSGAGNVFVGFDAGLNITTGSNNIVIEADSGTDNCSASASANDTVYLCTSNGPLFSITGGGTPSTSTTTVAGTLVANGSVTGTNVYASTGAIVGLTGSTALMSFAHTGDLTTGIYFPVNGDVRICGSANCPFTIVGDSVYTPDLVTGTNAAYKCLSTGNIELKSVIPCTGGTQFTVTGCGTAGTIVGGASAGTFVVGTGAATCTFVFTINGATGLSAPHGWIANVDDATAKIHCANVATASTTTASALCNSTVTTADVITFSAVAY